MYVKYIYTSSGCVYCSCNRKKKEDYSQIMRSASRSVITPGQLFPSAQRGKRYSLITDDKWFVSAVMRPG